MVAMASLQVFGGLAAVLAVVLYLLHRRTGTSTALLGAVGAAVLGLYLMVAITLSLLDVF